MSEVITALREALGARGLLTGDDIATRPAWFGNGSEGSAAAVIRPADTGELSRALAICHAHNQPVVPQGGLTGLVHGADTGPGVLALSTERMKTIEDIDPVNRTMTVQAGVPLQVVQEAAEANGLLFGLDLGARGSATIGGNISTNAGGNRVIRYGMMRDMVLGLEAVLADGTVVGGVPKMIKNNSGYDLKQMFIGTEGTLGIVSRAVLRLRPLPTSQCMAFVALDRFEDVTALLGRLDGALAGTLTAFEVIWKSFYDLLTTPPATHRAPVAADHPYFILIEAMGFDQASDDERFQGVLGAALEDGLIVDAALAQSRADCDAFWAMRDDVGQVGRNAPIFTFDVSLGIHEAEAYLDDVNAALAARWADCTNVCFGHLGDGNIHVIVGVGDRSAQARHAVEEIVYGQLARRGGSISAEHGIGLEKKPWLGHTRSDADIALMRTLKQALDPLGILNPGKVV